MHKLDDLTGQLADARRSHVHLTYAADMGCATAAEAYAVQAQVVRALGDRVAGWKVGIGPDGIAMAAPILDSDLVADGGTFSLAGDLASVKVEAELALRLGRDLPARPGAAYSRGEILDAAAELFCGIELVATRFRNEEAVDFATRLADNFAHAAYAAGGGTTSFATLDLTQLPCTVVRDGEVVNDRPGGHPLGDPLIPVMAWAAAQCDLLGGLRAGQFITTGTLIEPFAITGSTTLQATLKGIGCVSLQIASVQTP